MLDLGKAIKENRPNPELIKYKEEILSIGSSMQLLNQEKQSLLEYSIENRILMEVYSYMIWIISEKQVGNDWVQIWNTYEEFLGTDDIKLLTEVTKLGAVIVTDEMTRNL